MTNETLAEVDSNPVHSKHMKMNKYLPSMPVLQKSGQELTGILVRRGDLDDRS